MLDFLWDLNLPMIFVVSLVAGLSLAWIVLFVVRGVVRRSGFDDREQLPIRDPIVAVTSALFALMVAFSAAAIWTDTLQARSAVQREANALENALNLGGGLPADLRSALKSSVEQYVQAVVSGDWPAMLKRTTLDDPVFRRSDQILVQLIDRIASAPAQAVVSTVPSVLLNQLFETRHARVTRLSLAEGGLSVAQWTALLMFACLPMVAIALTHNRHFASQAMSLSIYGVAVAAAFFVILSHDRPFIGVLAVQPAPLQAVVARSVSGIEPALAGRVEPGQAAGLVREVNARN